MIDKIECYCCHCDICGALFEAGFSGFSIFNDDSVLSEEIDEAGWHKDDADKTYCDKCHHFDDDDNLILKEKSEGGNS